MNSARAPSSARRLAIAIPAYQAGPYVAGVAERAQTMARSIDCVEHVLVIDDGSSDDTASAARACDCEVVSHPRNLGKGVALRTAFDTLFARGFDAVITLDADGQHLPEELPKLMVAFEPGVDLVLGTRSHLFEGMSFLRRWSNRLSSRAISFAAGRALVDVQTGFRIYSRSLLERVPMIGDRFEAESAVVVRAARAGLTINSVPIELGFADGRHTSHYRPLADSLQIARAVIGARFQPAAHLRRVDIGSTP